MGCPSLSNHGTSQRECNQMPSGAAGPIPPAGCAKCATMVAPMPVTAVQVSRLPQQEVGDAEAVVVLVKLTFAARFRVSICASVQTRMAVG